MKKFTKFLFVIVLTISALFVQAQDSSTIQRDANGKIIFARFKAGSGASIKDAQVFLKTILQLRAKDELRLVKTNIDELGMTHARFQQFYDGVRVEGVEYLVHARNGIIETINGNIASVDLPSVKPRLNEKDALAKALGNIGAKKYKWEDPAQEKFAKENSNDQNATYFPKGNIVISKDYLTGSNQYKLSWEFTVSTLNPNDEIFICVDANSGKIINKKSLIERANIACVAQTLYSGTQNITGDTYTGGIRLREVRNAVNVQTMNSHLNSNVATATEFNNATVNWTNGNWPAFNQDRAALDAHWGIERVLDYWRIVFNRNSLNNAGLRTLTYVHYTTNTGNTWDNAAWIGGVNNRYMEFGDGDGFVEGPLTTLDIVGHEFGHGVMEFTANVSSGSNGATEADALNEGFSDIWGACVKSWVNLGKQVWLHGDEHMLNQFFTCERNLQNPNTNTATEGQHPDTYFGQFWSNTGEPHFNSTVLSHWFYLICQGSNGTETNDNGNTFNVTGIGINNAQSIVYRAETNYLHAGANYAAARNAMISASTDLFGATSCQTIAVINAWYGVGVGTAFSGFYINGYGAICSSSQYQVIGIPAGSTIAWSTNPTGIINVPAAGNPVTATKASNGNTTLTARVNGCVSVTLPLTTTAAVTAISSAMSGSCRAGGYQDWSLSATANIAVTSWLWTNDNPNVYMVIYNPNSSSTMVTVHGGGGISVTAKDGCNETFKNGVTIWAPCNSFSYVISPNPASNNIRVSTDNSDLSNSGFKTIQIIDKMGVLKKQVNYNSLMRATSIDVSSLASDMYVVKIYDGKEWHSQQILIRK